MNFSDTNRNVHTVKMPAARASDLRKMLRLRPKNVLSLFSLLRLLSLRSLIGLRRIQREAK